jgi:hypothetical protein
MSGGTASAIAPQAGGGARTPGILAIWNDRDDAIAQLYEDWYLTEHLPERLGVPGFAAARRYEATRGTPRFFTWYDVESPQVLSSADYLARLASPSPLTRQIMAHFRNMTRTVCSLEHRTRSSALGGCVVAAYIEQPAEVDDRGLLEAAAACERDPRVLGAQLWRAVPDPAHAATSEAKLRPGGDRRIEAALVVEVMREHDGVELEKRICAALRKCAKADVSGESGRDRAVVCCGVYRLLGAWQARDLRR